MIHMVTEKLGPLLEQYHRKKWFPDLYPDPYQELIDTLTPDRVLEFAESKDRAVLAVGHYLAQILPQSQSRDLLKDLRTAMSTTLFQKPVTAGSVLYHLRALDAPSSRELWTRFQEWNNESRKVLEDWLKEKLALRDRMGKLEDAFLSSVQIEAQSWTVRAREILKMSRDFFSWDLNRNAPAALTMFDLLRFFRWEKWDSAADWNDFGALAKSFRELCHIKTPPKIKRHETDPAIQLFFPVLPPDRVHVHYGKAAGASDSVRFLMNYAIGCFYRGMNPELPIEDRICGDPSLEHFWGCLYAQVMGTTAGTSRLIGPRAEPIAGPVQVLLQFRYRFDAMLALFERQVTASLKEAQDIFVDAFETAFSLEPPHFLTHYALEMAEGALARAIAAEGAAAAIETLSSLYGREWFASSRFAKRIRDYWWEGNRLCLHDVLKDLNVTVPNSYPFL